MNTSDEAAPTRKAFMSAEAIIGSGITVAWLGLLCVMLGWAQWLRQVPAAPWIWLPLGAVLIVGGGLAAVLGHSAKRR